MFFYLKIEELASNLALKIEHCNGSIGRSSFLVFGQRKIRFRFDIFCFLPATMLEGKGRHENEGSVLTPAPSSTPLVKTSREIYIDSEKKRGAGS